MRVAGGMCGLLLASAFGCSQYAVIGQLCRDDCDAADAAALDASAPDSGRDACTGPRCSADGGPSDAGGMCSESRGALTRMRLDLLLVVDDTASLVPWLPALQEGLVQMLQDETWHGVGVGLQRFDEVCEPEAYGTLVVPIAPLPENASALEAAFPFIPSVTTSTVPALDGSLRFARSWSMGRSDTRVAVVLLTDASPGACDGLIGDYVSEAQRLVRSARDGTPSIETYVVGFGVMEQVSAIASASETVLIAATPATREVKAALDRVRDRARPCAFAAQAGPVPAPGARVVATAADGSARRYPIHDARAGCDQQDGFYLDDPAAAFPLIACPQTCSELAGAEPRLVAAGCDGR